MGESYIGEVRLVGFNFAPVDWAFCNGAVLEIKDNTALFNLIGTTYGGDGMTNFALPNLAGRIPIHQGSNGTSTYILGQTGGAETVTVSLDQYPAHNHSLLASSNAAASNSAANNTVGSGFPAYSSDPPSMGMNAAMVGYSGGNQPHDNLQPFLVLNWIICLYGVYP